MAGVVNQLKGMDRKVLAICHVLLIFLLQAILYLYSRKIEKIPLLTTIVHVFILMSTIIVHGLHLQKGGKSLPSISK